MAPPLQRFSSTYYQLVNPLARATGLDTLPDHLPFIILGTCIWTTVHLISSPLFRRLIPDRYNQLSKRTQQAWDVHFVGFVHALYATPMAFYLLTHRERFPEVVSSPLLAYDPLLSDICAISAGYFWWDLFVSVTNVGGSGGLGFILHAVGCLTAFMNAFQPFGIKYLPVFLFWEASSIFLNIHWALDKLKMTGGRLQAINGVILLASFFLVRIVYGVYSTFEFFNDMDNALVKLRTPASLRNTYKVANIGLDILNLYWFRLMVKSVMKRFRSPPQANKIAGKSQ